MKTNMSQHVMLSLCLFRSWSHSMRWRSCTEERCDWVVESNKSGEDKTSHCAYWNSTSKQPDWV